MTLDEILAAKPRLILVDRLDAAAVIDGFAEIEAEDVAVEHLFAVQATVTRLKAENKELCNGGAGEAWGAAMHHDSRVPENEVVLAGRGERKRIVAVRLQQKRA